MNPELICTWLNISPANWPPDHYTLLGLRRGENDLGRIEQCVHERLARLRCFQLAQPDQATAAMNLLAQAFSCLTDPAAKKLYDAQLPGAPFDNPILTAALLPTPQRSSDVATERMEPVTVSTLTVSAVIANAAVVEPVPIQAAVQTHVDWQTASAPPVRAIIAVAPPVAAEATPKKEAKAMSCDPMIEVVESAVNSWAARRGLGMRRQIFERVWLTRQLVREWQLVGKSLGRLRAQQARSADEAELAERLNTVAEYLRDFPRLLGRPGLPGYRVLALRRLRPVAKAVLDLDVEQRKNLVKDWLAGHTLLLGYRRTLLRELRVRRKSPPWRRLLAATRSFLADHAAVVLISLGIVLALLLAFVL
jgi:hypothetical protein